MSLFDSKPSSMLVVAPHADDEVLGAGGLMATAAAHGWKVHVLYATISGYRSLQRSDRSETSSREAEVEAALAVLGAVRHAALFIGEEKHLRLDTAPQADVIGFLERGLVQIRPSIAIVPSRHHVHQDHRAVADACMAALRPVTPGGALPFVPIVLAYGHAASSWKAGGASFQPDVFVDIGASLDRKLEALACYTSQTCEAPHPRSAESVRASCAHWGTHAGVLYAEPFECLRLVVS